MKLSLLSLLAALAFALAVVPVASRAEFEPPDMALHRLENVVTLTPAQEKRARQIFQKLKATLDAVSLADRFPKGMQQVQEARAAIRAILTPEQQAVYDRTPQRFGGGGATGDPAVQALNLKIRTFVTGFAQTSPKITAQVGAVQRVVFLLADTSMQSTGGADDPAVHPQSGTNGVRVIGSSGARNFRISWDMGDAGDMTVRKVEAVDN